MANEWQYEMQAEEAVEKDVEATAKKIREAIDMVERWLKAYSRQNQAFESFLAQNGLQTEFEDFKKNWVPTKRVPITSLTADPASICIIDGGINISFVDDNDLNHFYNALVDLKTGEIAAVYSPGSTPGSDYIILREEEKWAALMEIGRIMAVNEQRIEWPPLLIQKTRSLVFAERYRELAAAVKGEDKADAAAFRMFFDALSGDGSKAMEAIGGIESEIRRIRRDADGGMDGLEEAIEKVTNWAAYAGISDEVKPLLEHLKTDAGTNTHRLQAETEALRAEVHEWLGQTVRAENAEQIETDAGNREESIPARTGQKTSTMSR